MLIQKKEFRWLRIILRVVILLSASFIILCFLFDHFVQFRMSDEKFNIFFRKNNIPAKIQYYTAADRRIRYIAIGNDSLPTLLFIHGAPSSTYLYTDYFKDSLFLKTFSMYAVDRPGYGYSGFGVPEPSIQKQAYLIHFILDSLNKLKRPIILVGESYGSSIACRIAMDYPDLVDGLVLVGPSLAPGEEKTYWFTPVIEPPLLHWFIPRMFQSANTEKIHHRAELTRMLPLWSKIHVPVIYLQGANDRLVYPSNARFAKKYLTHSPYLHIHFFKGRPHFIARTERVSIRQHILDMLTIIKTKKRFPNATLMIDQ
jgi:pimeloyl-ACP methyl ester carboxylesterase